jgi:hypothetical protein
LSIGYERTKAWRIAHPGTRAEEARRYRVKHPETNKKARATYRAKHLDALRRIDREARRAERRRNPELEKARQQAFYERKEKKLIEIAGRPRAHICDICRENGPTRFDHCHQSRAFRGWLCDRCNRTLGQVKDDPALLRAMAEYVEATHGRVNGCEAQQTAQIGVCRSRQVVPGP